MLKHTGLGKKKKKWLQFFQTFENFLSKINIKTNWNAYLWAMLNHSCPVKACRPRTLAVVLDVSCSIYFYYAWRVAGHPCGTSSPSSTRKNLGETSWCFRKNYKESLFISCRQSYRFLSVSQFTKMFPWAGNLKLCVSEQGSNLWLDLTPPALLLSSLGYRRF